MKQISCFQREGEVGVIQRMQKLLKYTLHSSMEMVGVHIKKRRSDD